jgi:ATP-dependent DNA helicase RecQ
MTDYKAILKEIWGYDDFRGIQQEIIESIGNGQDTLGLMPTGGGKSITFQVPAMAQPGCCLVVTPLIALMKDQVEHLRNRGIKATAIYTGLTRREVIIALENCIFGDYKFLYVSPERLGTELFKTKLRHIPIRFITVDEAHCISQWGYDFRPSYLKIAEIRKILPQAPILALTATATPEVVQDIQDKLAFRQENVFKMSFHRKNLAYVVRNTEDKLGEMVHILDKTQGSAIVYLRSREETVNIAEVLISQGISAVSYHAGLTNATKDERAQQWQNGDVRVMVATNAFGMGIDKPDVRVVIHLHTPDSPEAYFQEAGRAGRDGEKAYAVLIFNKRDRTTLLKRVPASYPDKQYIREVYEHLAYYYQLAVGDGCNVTYVFNMRDFCTRFHYFPIQVGSALKILTQAGYIDYTEEEETSSRIMFLMKRNELYQQDFDEECEKVLRALLRLYGGMFAEYIVIEEERIAKVCDMDATGVYQALLRLTRARVLHYIPRRRCPYVTYLVRRVEMEHIVIPKQVYEDRKEQYTHRIDGMLKYAESEGVCRSRLLLEYFGEHSEKDCGICDVCVEKRKRNSTQEDLRDMVMTFLADGKPHTIQEVKYHFNRYDETTELLRRMLDEGIIVLDCIHVRLASTQ